MFATISGTETLTSTSTMKLLLLVVCIAHLAISADGAYSTNKNTGFSISSIRFDTGCMNYGCWKINVDYTLGALPTSSSSGYITNVLYVPRINGASQLNSNGQYLDSYTQVEQDSYIQSNFPCGGASGGFADACCLQTFHDQYRPALTFDTYVQNNVIAPNCSTVSNPLSNITTSPYLTGQLSGMSVSQVVSSGTSSITLEIDDRELRQYAGTVTGYMTDYTVKTFVGIATFTSTDTFNLMSAYATQHALTLQRIGTACCSFPCSSHPHRRIRPARHQRRDPEHVLGFCEPESRERRGCSWHLDPERSVPQSLVCASQHVLRQRRPHPS